MRAPVARRLSILLLAAAAVGTALAIGAALTTVVAIDRDAREMAERTDRLRAALADIQTAQDGFLASGSVTGRLLQETAARLREIQADALRLIGALRSSGTTAEAAALIEAAGALGETVDRGHDNLTAGRDLMAADLLLSGTEDARRTLERTSRALQAAEATAGTTRRTAALVQAWAVFSVAALAGAVLLLLRGRARAATAAPVTLLTAGPEPDAVVVPADAAIDLQPAEPVEADAVPALEVSDVKLDGPVPPGVDLVDPVGPVDLAATAALCTAIARMATAAELPDLLAQVADNVRASGIVVWMALDDRLIPVASHGYEAARFGALGAVRLTDVNATAAAWRTGRTQIVSGEREDPGAVVVPMHRPDRCVGVLAVELHGGREHETATAAVTTIVAAQFAAVLAAEEPAVAGGVEPAAVSLPTAAGS